MEHTTGNPDYVCANCKGALRDLSCESCGSKYSSIGDVYNFLSGDSRFADALASRANYDSIYSDHQAAWEDQGRGPLFRTYFASLLRTLSTGSVLEIGCGEGFTLQQVTASSKWATDISPVALARARERTGAHCAAALAEMLPYQGASMDLIFSIGVMEHFLDVRGAHREISRILRAGGHYVALIHVRMSLFQRIWQKTREYLLPPRPLRLFAWLHKKTVRPISQKARNIYTLDAGRAALESDGLQVISIITVRDRPRPPLAGPHVAIYVCKNS